MGDRKADGHDKRIGMRIAAMRSSKGLSQTELGEQIGDGVTFQQVQKYEKGVNRISATALYDIATALGCSVLDFYDSGGKKRALDTVNPDEITKEGLSVMAEFNLLEPSVRRAVAKIITELANAE